MENREVPGVDELHEEQDLSELLATSWKHTYRGQINDAYLDGLSDMH